MSGNKHPRSQRRSEGEWRALFAEQAQSGLSVQGFCVDRGVGYSTFSKWKSRLGNGIEAQRQAPRFVELSPREALPSTHWDVELTLGADIVLRVARH